MVDIKVNIKTLPKRLEELESLKKKSYSSMELRNRNQMMNRLKRMQDIKFNKEIDLEKARLRNNLADFHRIKKKKLHTKSISPIDMLDEDEKVIHSFSDILRVPERREVKRRGSFWGF